MWKRIRDTEKWQIGKTYADAYGDGKQIVVSGLKSALLKVRGFDFVPENLRSDTFIKAADQIFIAHEGMNNFYNEALPVKNLLKLGSTIPTQALPSCMSALLCVVLGNSYGTAWSATPDAFVLLDSLSPERWAYYLNRVLPGDIRILDKLLYSKPRSNWITISAKYEFENIDIKNKDVDSLIKVTIEQDGDMIQKVVQKLKRGYLGKRA
jgi:hypothetical protein